MRRTLLFSAFLASGFFVVLCAALYFQQNQKNYFREIKESHYAIQRELTTLNNNIDFLKEHREELDFLIKRGWFVPKNRLIGAEAIKQRMGSLNGVRFTFEPEIIKEMEDGRCFKISKIIIEASALFDTDIYDFFEAISKNFPGILVLRKFSIVRNEKMDALNMLALRENKRPHFVVSEIIFEWFAMGGKKNEQ